MSGLECDADLAVGLKAADAWPVTSARIYHNERPALRIHFDPFWGHNADKDIIHCSIKLPAIHNEFHLIIEDMRSRLS